MKELAIPFLVHRVIEYVRWYFRIWRVSRNRLTGEG